MGKLEKLVARFLALPPEVRFSDVTTLLEQFGYIEVRSRGSHHTFENADGDIIVVPKKKGAKVKRTYVKAIVKQLNLEEWQNDTK
jgi:predicted RNA binding protein YcfA (HicA-like mRNA interferase family)